MIRWFWDRRSSVRGGLRDGVRLFVIVVIVIVVIVVVVVEFAGGVSLRFGGGLLRV